MITIGDVMQKYMRVVIVFATLLLFLGFVLLPDAKGESKTVSFPDFYQEKRAMFISYLEIESLLKGKQEEAMKEAIDTILETLQVNHFDLVLLQVRSFSDSIYPSYLFPSSTVLVNKEGDPLPFDVLAYFLEKAHSLSMELYAWVNPYRIRSHCDLTTLSQANPCYKWLGSDHVHVIEGKGIFYNPASSEVRSLILSGIKEILENYDVDGILFDDYFYPDLGIDQEQYQAYQEDGGELSLEAFRYEQVNALVQEVHALCQGFGVPFGVSPEGNLQNNYDTHFIDVKRWLSEEGFVDFIMPQIYFGFYHEIKPFYETLQEWNQLITSDHISLYPALAFYKSGTEDVYAKSGREEWIDNTDLLMRQVIVSRGVSHYRGFAIFRYEYIFGEKYQTTFTEKERQALLELF